MRFVLVHGGYHGAWCWKKLVPELEALGHQVLAIDLPGAGERMKERASLASWRGAFRERQPAEGAGQAVRHLCERRAQPLEHVRRKWRPVSPPDVL